MSEPDEGLRTAEERFEQASAELHRQQVLAKLCVHDRLAYASLTDDQLGPMLVTYHHKPIGEVHTTSPSALRDWYARPYRQDGSLGAASGPYMNARAAAASMIPNHAKPDSQQAG